MTGKQNSNIAVFPWSNLFKNLLQYLYFWLIVEKTCRKKKEYSFKESFTQLCPHFRPLSCSLAWQPPYAITKECERTLKLQNQLMSRSRFPALKIYWRYHTVQWVIFDKIFQGQDVKQSKKYHQKMMLICQQNWRGTSHSLKKY